MNLETAIEHAKDRWKGKRKAPNNIGWANALGRSVGLETLLDDITTDTLILYRDSLTSLTPATIYARLSVASVIFDAAKDHGWLGTKPHIPYPHMPQALKWWLNPTREQELMEWLLQNDCPSTSTLRQYVQWARLTGLRVEETLRLTRSDFYTDTKGKPYITIPGTKTANAQASLPLSTSAWDLAQGLLTDGRTQLFPMSYYTLYTHWKAACRALGWNDEGALKALRRGYARDRALQGMPLPILQQMMRHGSPATTLGYLKLTGGEFTHEEVAQWL